VLEPEGLPDLVPLGSHVFYRTLVTIPSAMRTYYESLKDRQLSLSLLAFVSRNYSPVIIQHEFSALREPRAMAALTEEGLNVRIAQGGGASIAGAAAAEAIASYVVDEQPMEIGIRLPAEFPLKAVDVRDLRRVGVPENKWRGWLMSVQQTITSRVSKPKVASLTMLRTASFSRRSRSSRRMWRCTLRAWSSAQSATLSSRSRTARCRPSRAARARTASTRAVSSSGSTRAIRAAARCAEACSNNVGSVVSRGARRKRNEEEVDCKRSTEYIVQ